MASTPTEWLEFHAPQFTDDSINETALQAAQDHIGVWGMSSPWGTMHAQAIGLVAAHILTLRARAVAAATAGGGLGGGTIASMNTGGISISWSSPTGGDSLDAWLGLSEYGKTLLELQRRVVTTPIVAGGDW